MRYFTYTPHIYTTREDWGTHIFLFMLIQLVPVIAAHFLNAFTSDFWNFYYFLTACNIGVLLLAVYDNMKEKEKNK